MASLMDLHRTNKRLPQPLLRDKIHEHDFAGPISLRASRILGPIRRSRIAEIPHHLNLASSASRPGLTFGFLQRILSNGLCTARRFHGDGEEQTCRVGCPDEPDSLSYTTTGVLCCTTSLVQYGDKLLCYHGEAIFSMT